jgi:hypothetical protein
MSVPEPEKIAGDCRSGDCPAVYAPTDGMVPVQGHRRTDIPSGEGEAVVDIPVHIFLEAARALDR